MNASARALTIIVMGRRLGSVTFALAMLCGVAAAEESPWSQGVSVEQRAASQTLLDEANDLFVQSKHLEALAKYKAAAALWNHPAIHFNMARTLIALGRPLEASESLEKALQYGKGPFEDSTYTEALNYRTLLVGQIATIAVSCTQAGVAITVDGAPFLTCPGTKTQRIAPGSHAIVGTKQGFVGRAEDVVLAAGKTTPIELTLQSVSAVTVTRTRWATWKPWAVAGSGAVVVGLGLLVQRDAKSQLEQTERDVTAACPQGCSPGDPTYNLLLDQESSALREGDIAIGVMAVGAATVATGIVLAIVNRPRSYVPHEKPVVTPTVINGSAGVSVVGSF